MLPNHNPLKTVQHLNANPLLDHAPKVLVLFGSLRQDSQSRKLALEVETILSQFGADVKVFEPEGLPIFDGDSESHPKVQELRELSVWSEGQVWISPEIHGNFSGVFKNQIDWLPLKQSAVRATQGKTLAVMQLSGGSQSFNAVNNLRVLGRWMRMFAIPNQSSIAKAWQEFDSHGKLKDSPYRDRVIDVLEELFKITLLMRSQSSYLTERFSEQKSEQKSEMDNQALEQALGENAGQELDKPKDNSCCKTAPQATAAQTCC